MLAVQLLHRLGHIAARCNRLLRLARHRYRPEQHYMRGPGPKWYAKHQGGAV
ncbi:MAG: hypothetical protein ABW175_09800 [Bradyrhizobium sp.]